MANVKSVEDRIKKIAGNIHGFAYNHTRDITCWDYYNERYDDTQFEYLTKVGAYVYPARLRNVGMQRTYINLLVGTQARRPFVFNVRVLDKRITERKYKRSISKFIEEMNVRLRERISEMNMVLVPMQQQLEQLKEMVNQEPQNEEQAMQLAQLKSQIPVIEIQLQMVRDEMLKKQLFTQEELEQKERFQKYTYKDIHEEHAQIQLSNLRIKHNAHKVSVENFKSNVVTGKQFYFVNYENGAREIDYHSLLTTSVYYPQTESVKWTHEGDWVGLKDRMSYEAIFEQWGSEIPQEARTRLEQARTHSESIARAALVPTSSGGAVFASGTEYTGNKESGAMFDVIRIWYKQGRWVYAKEVPNPHKEGGFFFHVIKEEDLDKVKKGEKLHKRYVYDRYVGVVIDKDIFVGCKKDDIQPRPASRPSEVYLPIVGRTYGDLANRPYSLIWSTKDLQDLYRIVHYMRELVIATSGIRTKLIDMSQMPDDMNPDEHEYHAKLGRLYIKTRDEFGRIVNSSFNQWKDFDDTLQPSIQYYGMVLDSIASEIKRTMGLSEPRLGERTASDQVRTNQQSQQQSELITEILYYEHDEVEAKALSLALKLEMLYLTSPGQLIEGLPMDMQEGTQFSKVPAQMFGEEQDYEVVIVDTMEDQQRMGEVRQMVHQSFQKGMLGSHGWSAILGSKSLKEMEKKFEYFEQKQAEIMEKQRSASAQEMMMIERNKVELANQYEKYAIDMKAQSEQLKAEVDMRIAGMEDERERQKLMAEEARAKADREIKLIDISTERDTEENYLDEQRRANMVNEELQTIKMKIDYMMEVMGKELDVKKEQIKARSQAYAKERIKD